MSWVDSYLDNRTPREGHQPYTDDDGDAYDYPAHDATGPTGTDLRRIAASHGQRRQGRSLNGWNRIARTRADRARSDMAATWMGPVEQRSCPQGNDRPTHPVLAEDAPDERSGLASAPPTSEAAQPPR